MSSFEPDTPSLRSSRHARLFDLFRSENAPPEVESAPRKREDLTPEDARRIQSRAIASLSREIPSRQRIFRRNQSGLQRV